MRKQWKFSGKKEIEEEMPDVIDTGMMTAKDKVLLCKNCGYRTYVQTHV